MSDSEKRLRHVVNGGNKEKTRASSEASDAMKNNDQDRTSSLTLESCQKELHTPVNEKDNYSSIKPSNKRMKQTSANGDASYSRPSRRLSEKPASGVPLSPETSKSKMKQIERSNYGTSDLDSSKPDHPVQSNLKHSEDSSQPSDPMEIKVYLWYILFVMCSAVLSAGSVVLLVISFILGFLGKAFEGEYLVVD